MKKKITTTQITKLCERMGNRAALASRLDVSEISVRRWEKGDPDINGIGYRFEVERLLFEYGIN